MPKYIIWDKRSDIFWTVRNHHTGKTKNSPSEIFEAFPWTESGKAIISGGVVNGAFFEDFHDRVAVYRGQGVEITDGMTDWEILDAMERYDSKPPIPSGLFTEEQRIMYLEGQMKALGFTGEEDYAQ